MLRAWKAAPVLAALVAPAFSPGTSPAQSTYTELVRFQLSIVQTFAESVGYQRTHEYHIGSLRDNQSDSMTITLRSDRAYRIVAFCDQDCTDVDLYLYGANNVEIDKDIGEDDAPIITSRPLLTGQFTIKVRMYECNRDPCYFGIGVFGTPREVPETAEPKASAAANGHVDVLQPRSSFGTAPGPR